MARPTDGPLFAEGGGNPSAWPVTKETNGYAAQEKLPAADFNGVMQNHGQWIAHLEAGGHFTSLSTGVGATATGESFMLAPGGPAYEVAAELIGSLAGEPTAVAIDAERFYVAYQTGGIGIIRGYLLSALGDITTGTQAWIGPGLSGTDLYTKIVSNGTYLAAIFDTEWHVYDCTDGTLVYSGDHTAALRDVAITADYVMVVGVADASNIPGRVIDLADGSVANLPSWGVSLDAFSCCAVAESAQSVSGGVLDLFFMTAEADGSSNQIALVTVTSAGAAGYSWQSTVTRAISPGARCTSNGRAVFVHNGDTGAWLVAYSIVDGSVIWEKGITCALPEIICDAKDIWLATDDTSTMYVIDPTNGGLLRSIAYTAGASTTLRPPLAANSQFVLRGTLDTGSLAGLQVIRSGLRVRRWVRESAAPHFNQATPEVL